MKSHSLTLVVGAAALAFSGLAPAAAGSPPNRHEITIQLPGGGAERIEYTGEAPRVAFAPAPFGWPWMAPVDFWAPPSFVGFEQMSADIERRMDALFKDQQMLLTGGPLPEGTTFANLAPGAVSTTWVSTSFGNGFCTRETRISKASAEAKPEVVSRQSGDCGSKSLAKPMDSKLPAHGGGVIETSLKTPQADGKPYTL
jgi:hypothetical protein